MYSPESFCMVSVHTHPFPVATQGPCRRRRSAERGEFAEKTKSAQGQYNPPLERSQSQCEKRFLSHSECPLSKGALLPLSPAALANAVVTLPLRATAASAAVGAAPSPLAWRRWLERRATGRSDRLSSRLPPC
jgi:hypothetical protein